MHCTWRGYLAVAGIGLVALTVLLISTASPSTSSPPECTQHEAGGPMRVTADCVDPLYSRPVIDNVFDLARPVPHRRVSGHFDGTEKRFNFYFPPRSQWEGRFFQLVYPTQDEVATDESIRFGVASGAYTVQTNSGGGYRVDAAAAKFSKAVAAGYYLSPEPIHGYVYGGSGGSFQTFGAIENCVGVWNGAVPFIPGAPTSVPNNFFIRQMARLVLLEKAPLVADAVSPGGSGDPYAGLDPMERAVLLEVTQLGVPLRGWEDYSYLLRLDDPQGLLGFASMVQGMDPTYADDFWTKPGYLGTEQSALGDWFRAAAKTNDRWSLALASFHRHQVPKRPGFYAWDHLRGRDGKPLYPQRPTEIGPLVTRGAGGGTQTGAIQGKIIVVANLLDVDAYPWDGDWYSARVRESLGQHRYDDSFRLWYNDNADHIGPRTARLVQYEGILQQALRDLSAWVERGTPPPRSTRYQVVDSQIRVPDDAAGRLGIQPVVELTVNGAARIDVAAGQAVTFVAKIQVPPGAGEVVATEWDLAGTGNFTAWAFGGPRTTVEVSVKFTYTTPGLYFPALRATAQRESDPSTPFAKVQNLGRVRVVVH